MYIFLLIIILVGMVGVISFLSINKGQKPADKNEADDFEIKEIQ